MTVVPPLIQQAEDLWRGLPARLEQLQDALVRAGILSEPITLDDRVQQEPRARQLLGIIGAILAVPTAAIGLALFEELFARDN
jgi:hypothetical protein